MAYNISCFKKLQVPKNENYLRVENSSSSPIFIYAIEPPHNVHTGFELKLHIRASNNISSSGIAGGSIGLLHHPYNHAIFAQDGFIASNKANIVFPKYCPSNYEIVSPSSEGFLRDFNEILKEGTKYSDSIGDWFGGTGIFYGTPYVFVDPYPGGYTPVYYNWSSSTTLWDTLKEVLLFDKIIHLRYIEDYQPLPQNLTDYIEDTTGMNWSGSTERKGWWIIENITIPCIPNEFKETS
ncbi:MAG TPA: hypothetical protein P5509_08960 [Bacteroidales bacterium]|nr:hypothetical protein [Bacteroidales bacterium]